MKTPKLIYELLPVVYFSAGVYVGATLEYGWFSAAVLIAAALIVVKARIDYRCVF